LYSIRYRLVELADDVLRFVDRTENSTLTD
jgi:hypothetical protein